MLSPLRCSRFLQLRSENDAHEAALADDEAAVERLASEIEGLEAIVQEVAVAAGVCVAAGDAGRVPKPRD